MDRATEYLVQQVPEDADTGSKLYVPRYSPPKRWNCQRDGCGQINEPTWRDCVLCGEDRAKTE